MNNNPCPKCKESIGYFCKECKSNYMKKYRIDNKDKINEKRRLKYKTKRGL